MMQPVNNMGPGMQQGGFGGGPGMYQGGPGMYRGPGMQQGHPGMQQPGFGSGPGMYQGGPGMQPGPNQMMGGPSQGMVNPNQVMVNPHANALQPSGRFAPTPVSTQDNQQGTYATTQECWGLMCGWLATYVCCCCCNPPYQLVPQGFTGIIQRFGKFHKLVGPGMHYLNPELDQLVLIDKREQIYNLHKQVVQTRDNVTITIDAILYYKIHDSYKSKFAVTNLTGSLAEFTETILRNAIGKLTLQEVLEKKDDLSEMVMEQITKPAFNWGVSVTRALLQEVFFKMDQIGSMSQAPIAKKIAEAKVILSQADVEAARLMKEASQALATEAAMQIRYIESLESIAKTGNPKFIFFPADFREMGSGDS